MTYIDILPWNDSFETGLELIDHQHKRLVEIINQLAGSAAWETDRARIGSVFTQLVDYTRYHFKSEESIWDGYLKDHDTCDKHKDKHREFIATIHDFSQQLEHELDDQFINKVLLFLTNWLVSHILEEDMLMVLLIEELKAGTDYYLARVRAAEQAKSKHRQLLQVVLDIHTSLASNTLKLMSELAYKKKMTAELRQSQARLQLIIDNEPECIKLVNADGTISMMNPAGLALLGAVHESEVVGKKVFGFIAEDDRDSFRTMHQQVIAGQQCSLAYQVVTGSGERRWLETHASPIDDAGERKHLAITRDITARKQAEEVLQLSAQVFQQASEGIAICDHQGLVVSVNDNFCHIMGVTAQAVVGTDIYQLAENCSDPGLRAVALGQIQQTGEWHGEVVVTNFERRRIPLAINISSIRTEAGDISHNIMFLRDISETLAYQQRLKKLAHYDSLTGLPNKLLLSDRLQQAMYDCSQHQQGLAVAYVDLDEFKVINNLYGHRQGDRFLVKLAERIQHCLGEHDLLARAGGDEFIILMQGNERDGNQEQARCESVLHRVIECVSAPVELDEHIITSTASIGVTFYPQSYYPQSYPNYPQGDITESEQLIRQADQAMYMAKLQGKNGLHQFDPNLDREKRNRYRAMDEVKVALAEGQFELYYQPKVNMRTHTVVGVEALIRWNHPEDGIRPPATFIPLLEGTAFSRDMDAWVITEALQQIDCWQQQGVDLQVSVNLFNCDFQTSDFVERLEAILARFPQVDPAHLQLEILESSALDDINKVAQDIERCKRYGISFALDDFGTGYSSLSYLKRIPVDVLKIDKSFVIDMFNDRQDMSILQGIISLSKAFGIEVIAEGVETCRHARHLIALGCELGQGFGIARPMPAAEIATWMARYAAIRREDDFISSGSSHMGSNHKEMYRVTGDVS